MKTAALFHFIQDDLLQVEDRIRAQVSGYHPDIKIALELILAAGGKRIRPAVTLLVGKLISAPHERLVTMAAAIELLHTATLVHDDLIDGSLLRRGIPTLNSRWSTSATILTGDFLFACAARLASQTDSVPVIDLFSKTLTIICNGEITQLLSGRCQVNRKEYYERIYAKTASLFETSACSAAMIATASDSCTESLRQYGYEIGMAFQIMDDILDFTGQQATVGKPIGGDLRQGLVTLPTIYYVEQHADNPTAIKLLKGECLSENETATLIEAIRSSNSIKQSQIEASESAQKAILCLRDQPAVPERKQLIDLAQYIVDRDT